MEFADFGESVPRRADQASRRRRRQHHAFVDGAEEMQRAVRISADNQSQANIGEWSHSVPQKL